MKFAFLALKLLLSGFFLWLVFQHVDFKHVFAMIAEKPVLLVTTTALFFLQSALAGFRMPSILSIYGEKVGTIECIRMWLVGLFTSQTLVTFIAGDAFRVWLLHRKGISLKISTTAVIFDRMFGLAILLCLTLASLSVLLTYAMDTHIHIQLWALTGLCAVLLGGFLGSPIILKICTFFPKKVTGHKAFIGLLDMLSIVKTGFKFWQPTLKTSLTGLAMHLLNAVIIWVVLYQLGQEIDFYSVALVTFPIMLLTLLPISFAGWGVRESAMVTGLALFSVPSSIAMATSLIYGICLLLSSLPGAIILFHILWKRKKIHQESGLKTE